MKYIKEWSHFIISPEDKMKELVNNVLSGTRGGDSFFDRIDSIIRDPKNIDIIIHLFKKIYQKNGTDYNLALSGSFGNHILSLIKSKHIKCDGTIVLFNGSITSHKNKMGLITKNKNVELKFSNNDIESKQYIFVDDSYYSGTTEKLINEYLQNNNSLISNTYVIYDGNDKSDNNRFSLYRYYDYNTGRKWSVDHLIDKASRIDINIIDDIKPLIIDGTIETNRYLISSINKVYKEKGINRFIDPRNYNYDNQI